MTKPIHVAIHGAAGRMGQRLVALGSGDPNLKIIAAIDKPGHAWAGQDAGVLAGVGPLNVPLGDTLPEAVDVVIDFSVPTASLEMLDVCVARNVPIVVATTGFSTEQTERVRRASQSIAVLWSPSMSLAVNLAMKLSSIAADALKGHPSGVDVEIIERHHRYKEDAPSGTALKFGQIIREKMGQLHERHGREGRPGARPHNEIGYHAVRVGDNPGEHTIIFGLLGETLEISVRASSRDCYVHGALAAAKFVSHQAPGLYGMQDVLGI
ncbi:MAG TPA: 4-hydroxy-tetrahydrodipicolinate reductase [Pirellulales bacterium]|jgi:4-hydroxy-tetrahydrodipicolinate reductase|nr:4-hydroxy-tetrahydrodipicolinate reductase [Pirellulales bacterium]